MVVITGMDRDTQTGVALPHGVREKLQPYLIAAA